MNIGIVSTWFPVGAGYVSRAYREVLSKDHNVFIYARGGKQMQGDPLWDDRNVTWAPFHYNGIRTEHLIRWAKHKRIDVLFFNEQRYWKPVIAAKNAGFCIGAYIDYYTQPTVKAFQLYDFLICNTKRHFSVFSGHSHCYYIPWGTDIEKYKPTFKNKSYKLTFIINLGWEGKYSYDRKGLLLALQAFKQVEGDCQLLVYSQVELSNCLPTWQEKILSDNRVKFIFGTFDPFPYNEGDIYIYPSRLDGVGLSLPEALSCGLPAITTDCAPMNEFVKDGLNGYLVGVEEFRGRYDGYYWAESICSLKSLKDAIQSYINDKGLVSKQSVSAREMAEKHLDWRKNSKILPDIFYSRQNCKHNADKDIVSYALMLDQTMAPSYLFRFWTLGRDLLNYFLRKSFG